MEKINITEADKISEILDFVHDRIFELSDILYDKKSNKLIIPLTVIADKKIENKNYLFLSTWKNPVVEATLIFNDVTGFICHDDAEVGQGCINYFSFEPSKIILHNSIPVTIEIEYSKLNIELDISDKILKKNFGLSFGL